MTGDRELDGFVSQNFTRELCPNVRTEALTQLATKRGVWETRKAKTTVRSELEAEFNWLQLVQPDPKDANQRKANHPIDVKLREMHNLAEIDATREGLQILHDWVRRPTFHDATRYSKGRLGCTGRKKIIPLSFANLTRFWV